MYLEEKGHNVSDKVSNLLSDGFRKKKKNKKNPIKTRIWEREYKEENDKAHTTKLAPVENKHYR